MLRRFVSSEASHDALLPDREFAGAPTCALRGQEAQAVSRFVFKTGAGCFEQLVDLDAGRGVLHLCCTRAKLALLAGASFRPTGPDSCAARISRAPGASAGAE